MKVKLRLVYFFLVFIFTVFTNTIFGQYLPENGEYHYLKTVDDFHLYVLEVGNKNAENTFIVLHGGFGAEHSYLLNAILPHSDKHRFILFDQRGSLRSPAPDSLITFKNFIKDIELIRTEFELSKVNILGHSNGATIALDNLYHHEDKVNKLILIGCLLSIIHGDYFPDLDEPINRYREELALWDETVSKKIENSKKLYKLTENDTLSGIQSTLIQKIMYSAHHTYLMTEIEKTQNAFFNSSVFDALQQNESRESWAERTNNLSNALVNSTVQIYLINGEFDFVDPKGHVWKAIDKQLKHLRYTMIKDAGHNIWSDQPIEFSKILERALK